MARESQTTEAGLAAVRTGELAGQRRGAIGLPSGLKRGFRALRIRNYRLFWLGQLVSLTGSWMQTTAQAWLVLQLTSSSLAIGLVTTLQFLPMTLLSLLGGAVADRMPKHRLLIATQSAAMLQAAIFGALVATETIQIWQIYILATVQGIINAIDMPTRQALAVELVGREDVANAVALNSMLFNASRIAGPAIAGFVIAFIGIAPALFANAASFIAVIGALLLMDPSKFQRGSGSKKGPLWHGLREGLLYTWHTPNVLLIMIVVGAIGTFGYNFSVTLPLIAGFVLHTDAAGFGGLGSFLGIGSFAAALYAAYAGPVTLRRLLLGAGSFALMLAGVALSSIYALTAVLLAALGFAGVIFGTTANSLLQLTVPDELRGRVMGLYILLFAGSTPIGALLIGTASTIIGVPATLLLCAALCALGVGVALAYRRTKLQPTD
jgi:MFS family permease